MENCTTIKCQSDKSKYKRVYKQKRNLKMKNKKGFWKFVKDVVLTILPFIIKKKKGIKGTKNEQIVDDVLNKF